MLFTSLQFDFEKPRKQEGPKMQDLNKSVNLEKCAKIKTTPLEGPVN